MKINNPVDISTIEKEAKKDYFDRHTPFVHCESTAKKGEKFKVKVKLGNEYKHPDDFDHYISTVQLWDNNRLLAKSDYFAGTLANEANHLEVDFYIVATKTLKLTATAYCTKHGLWHSEEIIVEITE
jgi:superoxide reductase